MDQNTLGDVIIAGKAGNPLSNFYTLLSASTYDVIWNKIVTGGT
jgi:hypothetical protein